MIKRRKEWRKRNQNNFSYIENDFDFNRCEVGKRTYAALHIVDFSPEKTKVKVGSYCSIAHGTILLLGGGAFHKYNQYIPF